MRVSAYLWRIPRSRGPIRSRATMYCRRCRLRRFFKRPAVEITEPTANDSPQFAGLVEQTAQNFKMDEVSADKAYLSRKNLWAVVEAGATPYIPFKSNSLPENSVRRDFLWAKLYHYFHLHHEEFLAHYHKRSNVESAFSMIKAKFGGHVRSKNPAAQVNEALVKIRVSATISAY